MYKVTLNGKQTTCERTEAEIEMDKAGYKFQYRDNGATRSHYHNSTTGDTAIIEMVEADEKPRRADRTFKTKR